MHHHYEDITERISEPPRWFDENGVPRYSEPGPREVSNIYADEVAFVRIACQACGHRTLVAFATSLTQRLIQNLHKPPAEDGGPSLAPTLADTIRSGSLHYGDPPNDHSCSGTTMNCNDERVVMFYARDEHHEWVRVPALEILLPDGGADFDAEYSEATDAVQQSPDPLP